MKGHKTHFNWPKQNSKGVTGKCQNSAMVDKNIQLPLWEVDMALRTLNQSCREWKFVPTYKRNLRLTCSIWFYNDLTSIKNAPCLISLSPGFREYFAFSGLIRHPVAVGIWNSGSPAFGLCFENFHQISFFGRSPSFLGDLSADRTRARSYPTPSQKICNPASQC